MCTLPQWSGVSGLIFCGSLGENQCLQPDESERLLKVIHEPLAKRPG